MKLKQGKDTLKPTLILEPLSDRLLYSADPLGLAMDLIAPEYIADFNDDYGVILDELGSNDLATDDLTPVDALKKSYVVFVDTSVFDYQQIISSLLANSDTETDYVVYTLGSTDSIDEVTEKLTGHSNLAAVHFITHGSDASIRLGNSVINTETIAEYNDDLNAWKGALAPDGDLLFYGCNLANSDQGKELVTKVAIATQADVAASENLTGHESYGADWQLEFTVGDVGQNDSLLVDNLQHWNSVLTVINADLTAGDVVDAPSSSLLSVQQLLDNPGADNKISLREAILAANASNDADVITLNEGIYQITAIAANEYSFLAGDLKIQNPLTIIGTGNDIVNGGTTISGNGLNRVLDIVNAGTVVLQNLAITNGLATDAGGGIYVSGTDLELDNVKIHENKAQSGGGLFVDSGVVANFRSVEISGNQSELLGGGLFLGASTVNTFDTIFSNNKATNATNDALGGAAHVIGNLNTYTSTFKDNEADLGGAVHVNGTLLSDDTYFYNNRATEEGGAILFSVDGEGNINRSLFESNTARNGGGILTLGNLKVSDSTFSDNTAYEYGGAIKAIGDTDKEANIYRSTIADNQVNTGGGGSALYLDGEQTLSIQGSIIARNNHIQDIHYDVVSGGNNFTDAPFPNKLNSDIVDLLGISQNDLEAELGRLQGGQVAYYAIGTDSRAYNTGASVSNTEVILDTTRAQRTGTADIGAYEFRTTTQPPTIITNNELTLTEGQVVTVDQNYLSVIDAETLNDDDLIYTITDSPTVGLLKNDGVFLDNNDTFTQNDINTGKLTFQSDGPGDDWFSFSISDGSEVTIGKFAFVITAVNDAPTFDNLVPKTTYLTNGSPINIAPFATVSDEELDSLNSSKGNYSGATLVVARTDSYSNTDDIFQLQALNGLEIVNSPTVAGGKAISSNGTVIGEISYHDPGNSNFYIEFTDITTTKDINNIVRQITFTNTTDLTADPVTNEIEFTWTLHDGNEGSQGAEGAKAVAETYITRVFTAPELSINALGGPITTPEDTSHLVPLSIDVKSDLDLSVQVSLTATHGDLILPVNSNIVTLQELDNPDALIIEGLESDINVALSELAYQPDANYAGYDNIIIHSSFEADLRGQLTFENGNAIEHSVTDIADGDITVNAQTVYDSARGHEVLQLNGIDEHVTIESKFAPNDTTSLTLTAWVNIPEESNGSSEIVSIADEVIIRINSDGELTGKYETAIGTVETQSFTSIIDTGWRFIAYKIDPTNNAQTLYIDGIEVGTSQSSVPLEFDNPSKADNGFATTTIGKRAEDGQLTPSTNEYWYKGLIDDVRIYSRAIHAEEIAALALDNIDDSTNIPITVSPINDAPTSTPVALDSIAEDSGARLITQSQLLANASDVEADTLTAAALAINAGNGSLLDNGDGTWSYTPATNDDTDVSFDYTITDGTDTVAETGTLDITPVNDAPTVSPVTLVPIMEDSGAREITQAQLLTNANDIDGNSLTATGLTITSGNGALVDNGDGTWNYTPAANDDTGVSFSHNVTDGTYNVVKTGTFDITPVNDAPSTTPISLNPIIEDSATNLITQAELLASASDIESDTLTVTGLIITAGNGTLSDNGDATWNYIPIANDDTDVSFAYRVSDGTNVVTETSTLDITPVNDAPIVAPVTLVPIEEDSSARVITQSQLLTNATDVEGDALTATGLTITAGNGTLVDNSDGTWNYTPAANDDTDVSFSHTVTDGTHNVVKTGTFDITPVNDAPATTPVSLNSITEDSGVRLITQAELLANATDIEGDNLTALGLTITSGSGTLLNNGNGTWNYLPNANDDTDVSFEYRVSDGTNIVTETSTLDITPVNDAPIVSPVTLAPIEEDSSARVITQSQLLTNASDIEGDALTATDLTITSGNGTLVDNGDGTWNYTPAANDDTGISFSHLVTDGLHNVVKTGTFDITPVNDAPSTSPILLTPITEDSTTRLITQVELLANASDIESENLTALELTITSGSGTLLDNGDGTWNYIPTANDDTDINFEYFVSDGTNYVAATSTLDITPINDSPIVSPVTLQPIGEDSGTHIITHTQLLTNASDIEGDTLTATGLTITAGNGSLVDNGDGTWSYTPTANDDTAVSFSHTVTDGINNVLATGTFDITPVNDAPSTTAVSLTPIAEDNGARLITQAELLENAADIEGVALTASGLAITAGNGSLIANGDGTWSYLPVANDDTDVSFDYTVTDGTNNIAATSTLDITPINDAPTVTPAILAAIEEDSSAHAITQAHLLNNASDIEGDTLTATGLMISAGNGALADNGDGTWNYTPASNDDTDVSFIYTVTDGINNVVTTGTFDITPANDAPLATPVALTPIAEDSGERLITQAELLANSSDIENDNLAATGLAITTGNGTLVDNGDGTWNYTPATDDGTDISFEYIVSDSTNNVAATTTLDITPVNDAPTTTPATLTAVEEDSSARVITQAQLLSNANDTEADNLTASGLIITAGNGALIDNGDGTWNYTPAADDDTEVSFSYTVTDGTSSVIATTKFDILPINDAPLTTPVSLTPIAEDSGIRLITQADLLANASDIEGDALTATGLAITTGSGTLLDNGDGTWNYTPIANQDTDVSFGYTVSDGTHNVAETSVLNITPINDAPTTTQVTLTAIEEDSSTILITQAQLITNANDTDDDSLTATGLTITNGNGTVADNGDGTWSYTPAANDDTDISFSYTVTDGINDVAETGTLDITPVNDPPSTTPVSLPPITEDSGIRLVTQAELLANATDIEGDDLTATGLAITTGSGTLLDNGDGTWNYTPAANDDAATSFTYTVTDGSNNATGTGILNITPINDAPTTTTVALTAIAEDSVIRVINQAELLTNVSDIEGDTLSATGLSITTGNGTLIDNGDGTWNYTPASNDDTHVSFSYTITDGTNNIAGLSTLDITPVSDAPVIADAILAPQPEDTAASNPIRILDLFSAQYNDADGTTAIAGVSITANPATADQGTWEYTTDGTNWHSVDSVSDSIALVLSGDSMVRFNPVANFYGAPADLTVRAIDGSYDGLTTASNNNRFTIDATGNTADGGAQLSSEHTISIAIVPVNDAPDNLSVTGEFEIPENSSAKEFAAVSFTDMDTNDTHTITVDDERFEIIGGQLSLKAGESIDFEQNQSIPLEISVTDSFGATKTDTFILGIINVNEAPIVNQNIEDQTGAASSIITLPAGTYYDPDDDTLSLKATLLDGSELPGWLHFDPIDGTFTMTEGGSNNETVTVLLSVNDGEETTTTHFDFTIAEPQLAAAQPAEIISVPTVMAITTAPEEAIAEELEEVAEIEEVEEVEEETEKVSKEPSEPAAEPELEFVSILAVSTDQLTEVVQTASESKTEISVIQHRDNLLSLAKNEVDNGLNTAEYSAAQITQQTALDTISLSNLAKLADRDQTEITDAAELQTKVIASSVTLSSGLSVGYILWLLRGGTLLASVMASMPAWRAIDPLPILDSLSEGDENDTETLQSMVEESANDELNSESDDANDQHDLKQAS